MKRHILFTLLAVFALTATAQNRKALRINEVMVQNDSSIVDDYGYRAGWVELFNANFGPLEISSVYLTDDPTNPKKYPVPLGDVKTKVPKRQHVVFFNDGEPNRGTFHTNFVLTPGKENWIGIYDADGVTLIDEVTIPADLPANTSYARKSDGYGEWEVRTGGEKYITPSGANVIKDTNNKIEQFAEMDGHGFGMAAMAMCIVFAALLVLCVCFMVINKIGGKVSRVNKAKAHTDNEKNLTSRDVEHDSGEEIAAIVMALHEHLNTHDTESTVLTINKVKRAYSPWNSKIYGLRELPHR